MSRLGDGFVGFTRDGVPILFVRLYPEKTLPGMSYLRLIADPRWPWQENIPCRMSKQGEEEWLRAWSNDDLLRADRAPQAS